VDAFRLQLFQMRQFVSHGYSRIASVCRGIWPALDGQRALV
jgi:hypothetical protein